MLPTNQCSNGEELAALSSSVVAYSVLHNVLNCKFAFAPLAEILQQVTNGIQRATSTLPTHLQIDFRQAAQVLNSLPGCSPAPWMCTPQPSSST